MCATFCRPPPIDVIIPGQSADALPPRPGTHSPTNASIRATTIGEFSYTRTIDVRDLRIRLRNPVDRSFRGGAPVAYRLGAFSGSDRHLRYQRTSVPDGKSSTRPTSS
jgi:hypothetical protein